MLIREFMYGAPLPQILVLSNIHSTIHVEQKADFLFLKTLADATDNCYEIYDQVPISYHKNGCYDSPIDNHPFEKKLILRLLPYKRCLDRMMKKNFYKENKSLGPAVDFELAFQGVKESPYYQHMWKDGKRIKYYEAKNKGHQESMEGPFMQREVTIKGKTRTVPEIGRFLSEKVGGLPGEYWQATDLFTEAKVTMTETTSNEEELSFQIDFMEAFKDYPQIRTGKDIARNFYHQKTYLVMDRFEFEG